MAVSPENAQIYLVSTRLWVQFLVLKKENQKHLCYVIMHMLQMWIYQLSDEAKQIPHSVRFHSTKLILSGPSRKELCCFEVTKGDSLRFSSFRTFVVLEWAIPTVFGRQCILQTAVHYNPQHGTAAVVSGSETRMCLSDCQNFEES